MTLFATVVFVLVASLVAVHLARQWARRRSLFDQPNSRSSHQVPLPRLGGAAFIPVLLAASALAWPQDRNVALSIAFGGALATVYVAGLIDDLGSLSIRARFAAQFAAAALLLAASAEPLSLLAPTSGWNSLPARLILGIWLVGLINAYNFMDGIDGLAGLQAVVAGAAWAAVGTTLQLPKVQLVGLTISAAAGGFLLLNWHPARIFMGDAGSTTLGLLFAAIPLLATAESGGKTGLGPFLAIGFLLVWPFVADALFTFLRRMSKGENVFQGHRSHLYQRLVIAGQHPRRVAVVYGCLAGLGGVAAAPLVRAEAILTPEGPTWVAVVFAAGVTTTAFAALWTWTLLSESRAKASP